MFETRWKRRVRRRQLMSGESYLEALRGIWVDDVLLALGNGTELDVVSLKLATSIAARNLTSTLNRLASQGHPAVRPCGSCRKWGATETCGQCGEDNHCDCLEQIGERQVCSECAAVLKAAGL